MRYVFLLAVLLLHSVVAFAEGSKAIVPGSGEWGVNRRVAVDRAAGSNIGYFKIRGDFDCWLFTPTFGIDPTSDPGHLPNKPSYYFGIRGPGNAWNSGANNGQGGWQTTTNVEVDAGLEYDTRPGFRGWRAFISVRGANPGMGIEQVDRPDGKYWRGHARHYALAFEIDDAGFPHLKILGTDAVNSELVWNLHSGVVPANSPFNLTARQAVAMKRVIADTRPEPRTSELDGTRMTVKISDCKISYWWHRAIGDYPYENPLAPSDYIIVNPVRTGYDVPYNYFDSPAGNDNSGVMSARSRRRVDFPALDGAAPAAARLPNIIDSGRNGNSQDATEAGASRYTNETVRINLEVSRQGMGRVLTHPWARR